MKLTQEQLNEILDKHQKWLDGKKGGKRATLSCLNLSYLDFSYRNLSFADMSYTDMSYANLRRTNLFATDLRKADLSYVNLDGADIGLAKDIPFIPMACPDTGSFIAYKKARGKDSYVIVKLEITEDAKRSSALGRECRCSKAKVLAIENFDGTEAGITKCSSFRDDKFVYSVGEVVEVADFDDNRWIECATGIHFFINRQEAVNYVY